jgi:hypothetical protein
MEPNLVPKLFTFQTGQLKRFIPLLDRVVVQRAEAAITSKGGIFIPEKAQSKVLEGTVVAAGPGKTCFWVTIATKSYLKK